MVDDITDKMTVIIAFFAELAFVHALLEECWYGVVFRRSTHIVLVYITSSNNNMYESVFQRVLWLIEIYIYF